MGTAGTRIIVIHGPGEDGGLCDHIRGVVKEHHAAAEVLCVDADNEDHLRSTAIAVGELVVRRQQATFRGAPIGLGNNELQILFELAGASRPLSRVELLARCWPNERQPRPREVDVVVCRLRRKLHSFTPLTIETKRNLGYKLALRDKKRPTSRKPLLVVEDDLLTQRAIVRTLQHKHFDVHATGTVATALDLLERNAYGALFLDIGLPDGSGIEILRAVRLRDRVTPIMMVTARDNPEELALAERHSATVVAKPFSTSILVDFAEQASAQDA